MILGITFSSIYQKEFNFNISIGEKIVLDNNVLKLNEINIFEEKNYQALRASFALENNRGIVSFVEPGKNYYPVSKMITTEAGIYHDWFKDIYIIIGNENDNKWPIKVYLNPLVSFIWIGVLIMIFSSLVAVLKK